MKPLVGQEQVFGWCGAWWAIVQRVTKSHPWLCHTHTHTHTPFLEQNPAHSGKIISIEQMIWRRDLEFTCGYPPGAPWSGLLLPVCFPLVGLVLSPGQHIRGSLASFPGWLTLVGGASELASYVPASPGLQWGSQGLFCIRIPHGDLFCSGSP